MTAKDLLNIELPKWPRLLVKGDSVSKEQAMEIIVRTDSLTFSSNDESFNEKLVEIVYGVKSSSYNLFQELKLQHGLTKWKETDDFIKSKRDVIGNLDLDYLVNSQISSCWIGGAHGWCNWDGTINTSCYNIGKWPKTREVFNEWCLIAETFPFLNLRAQLIEYEAAYSSLLDPELNSEEVFNPLVEFVVKDGKVQVKEVEELLMPITEPEWRTAAGLQFREIEKGCSVKQFKNAYDFVKNKLKKS